MSLREHAMANDHECAEDDVHYPTSDKHADGRNATLHRD